MKCIVGMIFKLILVPALFVACSAPDRSAKLQEAPDHRNNPALMGVKFKKYTEMLESARLADDKIPWSGDYWPTFRGGVAYRWQTTTGTHYREFLYRVETKEAIHGMKQEDLDNLSPAEKYDLLLGDYGFALTKEEKRIAESATRETDGDVPHWYGLCHGWAAASYMEKQPGDIATVTSPDGLTLNFYSSDIKALLTKHYADTRVRSRFIGGRCNEREFITDRRGRVISPECRDTNPASYHLVIEEFVGHRGKSFIVDVEGRSEIWNQPIIGYDFKYTNLRALEADPDYTHAAEGTVRLIDVTSVMHYVFEAVSARYPVRPLFQQKTFKYTLELDKDDVIIGGEWISADRPDFMWELVRRPDESTDGGLSYQLIRHLSDLSRRELLTEEAEE